MKYYYTDPYCPVFKVGYILEKAEKNETERYLMLLKAIMRNIYFILF